jgi:hypothetical protein
VWVSLVDFLPSAQSANLCRSGEFTRERRCITTTKYEAAQRLVNSFSAIPTEWVKIVAAQTGAEFYGIMWGTMFLVNDPVDKRGIQALLQPVEDDEDELYGTDEVGNTGISAFEIEGELVLGINGAGYDFYEHHWIPLYEALGYAWHETL